MFIVSLCGAAAWMTDVNIWGNRVAPCPCLLGCPAPSTPVEGRGNLASAFPPVGAVRERATA